MKIHNGLPQFAIFIQEMKQLPWSVCMWFTNMKTSSKPKQNTIYSWGNFWIWLDDKPKKSIMWQNKNQSNSENIILSEPPLNSFFMPVELKEP